MFFVSTYLKINIEISDLSDMLNFDINMICNSITINIRMKNKKIKFLIVVENSFVVHDFVC